MDRFRQAAEERRWQVGWAALLIIGSLLQLWFWWRSVWIYLDQVDLYRLGIEWARDGKFVPIGKLSTGGLPIPGVLLQLLVGIPLTLWHEVRAPTVVLVVFHLGAILLLSQVLVRDLGWRIGALFVGILWLSPWRLFHAGFLWETNYLLLPAALHLVACRAQHQRATAAASALLGVTLMLSIQLHPSAIILLLSSAILFLRRQMRLHWGGLALGTIAGSLSLLPTILAGLRGAFTTLDPQPAAGLLVRLNSVEKGLIYWLRMSSLDVGRRFRQSLYCIGPGGGDTAPEPVLCFLVELTQTLALASVLLSAVAVWWFLRRRRESTGPLAASSTTDWYRQYSLSMLGAVLISGLLSPVLLQGWHVLIALPAACLPVAFWIAARWPTAGPTLRAILVLFVLWRIPASLLLLGHPMYARPERPELPRHIAPVELRDLVPDR